MDDESRGDNKIKHLASKVMGSGKLLRSLAAATSNATGTAPALLADDGEEAEASTSTRTPPKRMSGMSKLFGSMSSTDSSTDTSNSNSNSTARASGMSTLFGAASSREEPG